MSSFTNKFLAVVCLLLLSGANAAGAFARRPNLDHHSHSTTTTTPTKMETFRLSVLPQVPAFVTDMNKASAPSSSQTQSNSRRTTKQPERVGGYSLEASLFAPAEAPH